MWAGRLIAAWLVAFAACPFAAGGDGFAFRRVAYNYRTLAELERTGFDAVFIPLSWGSMPWERAKLWVEDRLRQRSLGAGALPEAENAISLASSEFQAGRYLQARSLLPGIRESVYQKVLADIWPTVQDGLASPRTSKVPITILRSISNAKRMLEDGRTRESEAYLFDGLRQWSAAVPEPIAILIVAALLGGGLPSRHA